MGWKGAMRSMGAAARRAERESQRDERQLGRSLDKVDRSVEAVLRKVRSLESRIERDVIKALGLRYDPAKGLSSEPFEIDSDIITGSIGLTSDADESDSSSFEPNHITEGEITIEPLTLILTRWATLVPFRISHNVLDLRLRLSWYKKTEPSESPVYLVDTENSEYYYPVATDLKGEVLAGHPRIGIMAFEKFHEPTSSLQMQFSEVKLGAGRGAKKSFSFEYSEDDLQDHILTVLARPTLEEELEDAVRAKGDEVKQELQKSSAGCLVFIVVTGSILVGGSAALLGVI